jgi:hypothetical protein
MNDLMQFTILKLLNPETKEDFDDSCDIFRDRIYFVDNCIAVGTNKPNNLFIHGTDWDMNETGTGDFVERYLSECSDFRKELDKLSEGTFEEDVICFDVLVEFKFTGETDSYTGEYDCWCEYLGIIQ